MTPHVTSNPANIFNSKLNLLVFFIHTDLEKAKDMGEQMLADLDEFLPVHSKDLHFMLGNIHFLSGDFDLAKQMFRQVLKMSPRPALEAQVLNNLAFCSWMHLLDLPKLKKELDGKKDADSGADLYEAEQTRILKEERFAFGYLRQSIELSEKSSNSNLNLTMFDELLSLDLEEEGVESLTSE